MNKEQSKILQMIETCSPDKAKFLTNLMVRASQGYDYALERDAQHIGGELAMTLVSENQGTSYGKKNISRCTERGGSLYTGIHHKFRENKTINDFDWSDYDPESLYNE